MKQKIEKVKTHVKENRKVYIATAVGILVGAACAVFLIPRNTNQATIDSWKLINYKSPHTSVTTQVIIPPRGNAGNAIQCDQTGSIYPSQNLAAHELGLNPGNLSSHLSGKNATVNGLSFTKLTENGIPLNVA